MSQNDLVLSHSGLVLFFFLYGPKARQPEKRKIGYEKGRKERGNCYERKKRKKRKKEKEKKGQGEEENVFTKKTEKKEKRGKETVILERQEIMKARKKRQKKIGKTS